MTNLLFHRQKTTMVIYEARVVENSNPAFFQDLKTAFTSSSCRGTSYRENLSIPTQQIGSTEYELQILSHFKSFKVTKATLFFQSKARYPLAQSMFGQLLGASSWYFFPPLSLTNEKHAHQYIQTNISKPSGFLAGNAIITSTKWQ